MCPLHLQITDGEGMGRSILLQCVSFPVPVSEVNWCPPGSAGAFFTAFYRLGAFFDNRKSDRNVKQLSSPGGALGDSAAPSAKRPSGPHCAHALAEWPGSCHQVVHGLWLREGQGLPPGGST